MYRIDAPKKSAAERGMTNGTETQISADAGCIPAVKEKKRLTLAGVEFVYVYILGIGTAFLGWVGENCVRLVSQGILDSRFHITPFISVYALVPIAFQLLLGDPDDLAIFGHRLFREKKASTKIISNLTCIVLIFAAVFFGELIVGSAWEFFTGVKLWNYSTLPLHVTQYAGLIPTVGYGGAAYLLFRFAYKPLLSLLRRKVSFKKAKTVCCTLGVWIVVDSLIMALHIIILHTPPVYWSVKIR